MAGAAPACGAGPRWQHVWQVVPLPATTRLGLVSSDAVALLRLTSLSQVEAIASRRAELPRCSCLAQQPRCMPNEGWRLRNRGRDGSSSTRRSTTTISSCCSGSRCSSSWGGVEVLGFDGNPTRRMRLEAPGIAGRRRVRVNGSGSDSGYAKGVRDPDLRFVLEIASDEELQELSDILYGPSLFSPLMKSVADGDGHEERRAQENTAASASPLSWAKGLPGSSNSSSREFGRRVRDEEGRETTGSGRVLSDALGGEDEWLFVEPRERRRSRAGCGAGRSYGEGAEPSDEGEEGTAEFRGDQGGQSVGSDNFGRASDGDGLPERDAFLQRLEARFFFLAADARGTLTGRRPTYRQVLLSVRERLSVECSPSLATEDLESEIFLHLFNNYAEEEVGRPKTSGMKGEGDSAGSTVGRAVADQGVSFLQQLLQQEAAREAQGAERAAKEGLRGGGPVSGAGRKPEDGGGDGGGWTMRTLRSGIRAALDMSKEQVLTTLLKGGSAVTLSTIKSILLREITGKVIVENARYHMARVLLQQGGKAVATRVESLVAFQTARQSLAGAAARYVGLRTAMSFLGPILWGAFLADVAIQSVGTDYARIVRAIYSIAQIRLTRTYGWTNSSGSGNSSSK